MRIGACSADTLQLQGFPPVDPMYTLSGTEIRYLRYFHLHASLPDSFYSNLNIRKDRYALDMAPDSGMAGINAGNPHSGVGNPVLR